MTDLDKLIEAIETERFAPEMAAPIIGEMWVKAALAYHGSLDAAISFYDSLLGHDAGWTVSQHIAKVVMGEFGADGVYESVIPRNPARALLLSTLKAYRSQQ